MAKSKCTLAAIASFAMLAVAGCQLEGTVIVVSNGARPRLVITYDRGKPACVEYMAVADPVAGPTRPVWAIRRTALRNAALCMDKFDYGVTPGGYETAVAPVPLVPNRRYEVSASGPGWNASTPLVVAAR